MVGYLARIVAVHREAAAADRRPLGPLVAAAQHAPPPRGFASAVAAGPRMAVIAELKRRSPSKGPLAPDLEAGPLAKSYEAGGAACLSVLTDAEFFDGSADDLVDVRAASTLPVLRKDFTVDERDVVDARVMGADAVLLIAAALDDAELRGFRQLATSLGLDALVEVHDEAELERALGAGARLVGVNARNLHTFELDRELQVRLGALVPAGVTAVAESGVRGAADARCLADAGYAGVLVGESLVTSADPEAAVARLTVERA